MSLRWSGPWADIEGWCREIWTKIEDRELEAAPSRIAIRLRTATLDTFPIPAGADDLVSTAQAMLDEKFTGWDESDGLRTAPITLVLVGTRENNLPIDLDTSGPWVFETARAEPLSPVTGPAGRAPHGASTHPLRQVAYPPQPPPAPEGSSPGYAGLQRSERTSMRATESPAPPTVATVRIEDFAENPLAAMAVQFMTITQMQFQQIQQINGQLAETLRSLTAPDGFLAAERDALIGSNTTLAKTLADLAHNTAKEAAGTVKDVIATQGKLKDAEAERRVAVEQAKQAQRDKDAERDAQVAEVRREFAEQQAREAQARLMSERDAALARATEADAERARVAKEHEKEAKQRASAVVTPEGEDNGMLQGLVGSVVEQALPSVLERLGIAPRAEEAASAPAPEPAPEPVQQPAPEPPRPALRPPVVRIPAPRQTALPQPAPPAPAPFSDVDLDLGDLDLGDLDLEGS